MLGPTGPLGTQWQPVEIVGATSEGKSKLTVLDDGSVLAGGPSPATDAHTIKLRTDLAGITALRLEPLADPSLPASGPGRGPSGGFSLGGIEAKAFATGDPAAARKLVFAKAEATVVENGTADLVIDANPKSGWMLTARSLPRRPGLILALDRLVGFDGGTEIEICLRCPVGQQLVLGRYRITVTADPQPRIGLPGVVLESGTMPGGPR
jgi:hypothetical protein